MIFKRDCPKFLTATYSVLYLNRIKGAAKLKESLPGYGELDIPERMAIRSQHQ